MFDYKKELEKFDWSPYLISKSNINNLKAREYFKKIGEIPLHNSKQYVLHHIDPTMKYFDLSRYTEWRIEDLRVMTAVEHSQLHNDFIKRNKEYGFLDKMMIDKMNYLCFNERR